MEVSELNTGADRVDAHINEGHLSDFYSYPLSDFKDMQRLAFAESKAITEYQNKGECLYQLPEGSWTSEDTWNELYRKRY